MPNWVSNTLTIEGNPDSVIKLKNQMNKPFTQMVEARGDLNWVLKERTYTNPIFAFWNVVAPTDLEQYHSSCDVEGMKNPDNWYNWNNRNWGTKWDVAVADDQQYASTELYKDEPNGENHVLVYGFETAWSPALTVLETLSSQYPDLLFTLNYKEETGWGGEMELLKGETISESEYNWQCYECDYEEMDEPPYCEECEFDVCPSCGYNESSEPCDDHKENNR